MFLEIVDCAPEEVSDIPAHRLLPTYSEPRASVKGGDGKVRTKRAIIRDLRAFILRGDWVMTFGKHKGKRLDEVPLDYLRWFVEQPPIPYGGQASPGTVRFIERFKEGVRDYLKRS